MEKQENLLNSFRQEIGQFRQEEIEGKRTTVHLTREGFNPEELTDRDQEIWEKIKNEAITMEEFNEYRDEVHRDGNKSRLIFMAMAANKATPVINKKYLESQKKK